ncbi:MAG: hypothetical protein NT007_10080 [Candidatus Kapabacteria bacterium]|nr:hypothetical protein [Candidatus Kapabacteria bacterium]
MGAYVTLLGSFDELLGAYVTLLGSFDELSGSSKSISKAPESAS